MKIAIFAGGSRGDIQPLLALATDLRRRGQQIRFCTQSFFEPIVIAQQLEFFALGGADPKKVWAESRRDHPKTRLSKLWRIVNSPGPTIEALVQYEEACWATDAIVCGTSSSIVGQCLAEKYKIPTIIAHPYPVHPTKSYPNPTTPLPPSSNGLINLSTHILARQLFWMADRSSINVWRKRSLGLAPLAFWEPLRALAGSKFPTLFGFSPAVVPKPPDWPSSCFVTGYWFMEDSIDPEPSEPLKAFLQAGAPPISIGFGSGIEPTNELTKIAVEAVTATKQRAVFIKGWGGIHETALPESVHVVETVQYAWLFPKVSIAVHAAGAGTTAEAVRAGIPSVTIPVGGDQKFWARRLAELGVAPPPIARAELTAGLLAEAIRKAATDREMQSRAKELGERVRRERGAAAAASLIVELLHRS